ncbi:hypothetical protein JRQ81_001411 [Phrynocephalus forsythii]|uniref:Cation channel sperm-associated targeting subunit tau C2 domain-containing protein n=1 Tax=Phrynocephalus forsythii TaxID=171643 RepID=A0A9Q0Y9Z5_9SAUR|nr:hypothetical protein JRQ81_001411 [Phrynocephalus forsythii]
MLLRNHKTTEDSATPSVTAEIHNLIPCGDVAGLLAVNVKQCKDFTPKFVVKRDTYLLVRISIDKIMKCTNPQIYRAAVKNNKKMNAVNFGDMKYFSVKVPMQKSDPRNRITLELVGFEGPKDFPRLFGNVSVHLYEVIQKQAFTEICAMRIRNMVFCTAEVEFIFCYGSLGYGYSHQLKLPGADPAKAVAYSMFLRVPPPENRKDPARNVIKPQQMDYPAFLSPDLNVTVGKVELDTPTDNSEQYQSLQKALKEPPRERLERMKQEYRSLKTWREKADYLDQLILKRGPKTKPCQAKVSRFKELVEKMQQPQRSGISPEQVIKEEKSAEIQPPEMQPTESQKLAGASRVVSHLFLPPAVSEPSHQETDSEGEASESEGQLATTRKYSVPAETVQSVPAVTVTSSTTFSPGSSESGYVLPREVTREKISQESETSLPSSRGILAEFSEAGDSESPPFPSQVVQEELPSPGKKASLTEYLPEAIQELHAGSEVPDRALDEFAAPKPQDSFAEPLQEWAWKDTGFQEAVFCGNKFEPFLRRVCKEPPPPFQKNESDDFSHLEETYPPDDMKEQEDQDPPDRLSLTKVDNIPDSGLIQSGGQLSILRLIERKMDLEEEGETIGTLAKKGSSVQAIPSGIFQKPQGEKPSEAEIAEAQVYLKRSLEDFLVDKLVNVVAVKSLLSQNIENLVAERLSEVELSQDLEDSSSLGDKEKCLPAGSSSSSVETFSEPYMKQLKEILSCDLQAHLAGELSEQGIISETELGEKDPNISFELSTDMLKRRKSLSKERISQTEMATKRSLSDSLSGNISKPKLIPYNNECGKETQPVVTQSGLSESQVNDREGTLSFKKQQSLVEGTNAETRLRTDQSKQPLEIIRVTLPLSSKEADCSQQSLSAYDRILEKVLKAEILSLKSFLSKKLQDHLKDKLSETGITPEDFETVCRKLSLNSNKKDGSSKEDLAEETPDLSESIQNLLDALSDSEMANLKSALTKKVQDKLSERLSKLELIKEKELKKILENLFPDMGQEASRMDVKGFDSPTGQPAAPVTQNLHDKFSEEELQNLKDLLSRLLKEGHKEKLSTSEIKGLASILQKSSEDLPIQNSYETGISKEVEIKDECRSISLSDVETRLEDSSSVVVSNSRKVCSKESGHKLLAAGEKHGLRRESLDRCVNSIFEVETRNQETQTTFQPKRGKQGSKKESHRLPGYPNHPPETSVSKRGSFEAGLKSKPPDEPWKKTSEPFAFSSFLSAHDIGIQTEIKNYLTKPTDPLPKPTFPVNPQTFLFLHSESEEEAKPAGKTHQRAKSKRKTDRKKEALWSGPTHQATAATGTLAKKDRTNNGNGPKEGLKDKGKKRGEPPSPKPSTTESRKDSKTILSPSGVRKESLRHKPERKQDHEGKPRKSQSKAAAAAAAAASSDLHLQNLARSHLTERASATNFSPSGRTKLNTLISADDLDADSFRHLEKAVERALLDLGQVPESSSLQGRPYTAPGAEGFLSKEVSRSFSSVFETPRNQAGSIPEMFHSQEQTLKMSPEQLEVVLKILQKVLKENTSSPK